MITFCKIADEPKALAESARLPKTRTSLASTKCTGGLANRVRSAPSHETYSVSPRAGRMPTPTPALPTLPPLPAGGRGWLRLCDCALSPLFNPLRFSPVRAHSHKHTYTKDLIIQRRTVYDVRPTRCHSRASARPIITFPPLYGCVASSSRPPRPSWPSFHPRGLVPRRIPLSRNT